MSADGEVLNDAALERLVCADAAAEASELVGGFNQAAQAWPAPADRDAGGGQTLTVHGTAQ